MNTMAIEYRNKQFIISKTEYKNRVQKPFFCKKTTEHIEKRESHAIPFFNQRFSNSVVCKTKPIV